MTGFVKIYGSILDSSLWSEDLATRVVFLTMLAMADPDGEVQSSVPGLARRANVTVPDVLSALEVLGSPDAFDRSGVQEGRRIESISGGWRLVNYQRYREMRTEKQIKDAERQAEWRSRNKRDVSQVSHEVSTSPSAFVVDLEGEVEEREAIREVEATMSEQLIDTIDFGPCAGSVMGLIRAQRSPAAVTATLMMHLSGEMGHVRCTPHELGLACQEYLGASVDRWSAAYFAGFVRRAKGRMAQVREAERIADEAMLKREREREERDARLLREARIKGFGRDNPGRFAELLAEAESLVDPKQPRGRGLLVQGKLQELIEREVDGAGG